MTYPHGVQVAVLTPSLVTDPYSGEAIQLDWATATSRTIEGVGIGPLESTEPTEDGRHRVVTGMALYLDSTSEVLQPYDRVAVTTPPCYAGVWMVDGEPNVYHSPLTGWAAGTVVRIKRVTG